MMISLGITPAAFAKQGRPDASDAALTLVEEVDEMVRWAELIIRPSRATRRPSRSQQISTW